MAANIMINHAPIYAAFSSYSQTQRALESNVSVFPSSKRVGLSRQVTNEWAKALVKEFNDLTALQIGWDGYAGRPVSFTCASFAANLLERLFDEALPPPNLVPGSDGTLQFEWHLNQYDVEVDVLGAFEVVATRYDSLTGVSEELELDTDFTSLAGWISEMTENRSHQLAELAV